MTDATPYRSKLWKPLRLRILARDGNACQIRGARCTRIAEDVDHIWSWRLGQQYWFDETNLRAACKRCNRARRGELVITTPEALPEGVHAHAGELVLADIATGRTWLLDPTAQTIRPAKGGVIGAKAHQPKTDDEW